MNKFKNVSSYNAPNGNLSLYEEWMSAKKVLPEIGRRILVCYELITDIGMYKRCFIGTYQSPEDFDGYGYDFYITYWKYLEALSTE